MRIGARKVVVGFIFGRAERGEQGSEDPENGEAVDRGDHPDVHANICISNCCLLFNVNHL